MSQPTRLTGCATLRFLANPTEPVCICVPALGSNGKFTAQPAPDCPIAGHGRLARELIECAEGNGRL